MNVGVERVYSKTKKALKEAVQAGKTPACYSTSMFHDSVPDGRHVAVGPDPYTKRSWFAEVEVKDEQIVRVIS